MLFYKLYQNNNSNSKSFGKWFGRTVMTEKVGIDVIAQRMQDSCTVKRSDVKAVLEELGSTIKDILQDSKRVEIPGMGCFKLSISTKGEDDKGEWTASSDVKRVKVLFQPETEQSISAGKRRRTYILTKGVKIGPAPGYVKEEPETDGDGGDGEGGGDGNG